jgi:DNA-binding PadR family transcriptional regulator
VKRHLKKYVLRVLAESGKAALGSAAICQRVNYRHERSMASYLRRLQKQGLIRASRAGRLLVFRISPKGVARLRWFLANPQYDFRRRFHS